MSGDRTFLRLTLQAHEHTITGTLSYRFQNCFVITEYFYFYLFFRTKEFKLMIIPFQRIVFSLTVFIAYVSVSFAQISSGGVPPGFETPEKDHELPLFSVPPPDIERLLGEDEFAGKRGEAQRLGVLLPIRITPSGPLNWKQLSDGTKQWRARIQVSGARSLALYYEDFYLPEGCRLFVYDKLRTKLIGAFTHLNNHESGSFANELIPGDELIVELLAPVDTREQPGFTISEVLFAYGKEGRNSQGFGDAGSCNVNVNCSEGINWKDQKRGVVKIQSRVGGSVLSCSGSLINNTKFDFTPYIFTADHCARTGSTYSTEQDLNQWLFYFNYESEACQNPETSPPAVSMVGAAMKAFVGGGSAQMGSDFCLLLLNSNIPPIVDPYYNGWSRINAASPSGVTIHHPSGDIKKISTYTVPLVTSSWNANTPNMYWQVRWSATENGHGVTEGGSSGSPLFNQSGLIIGQLTGGESACNKLTSPDYYGKFAISWEYGSEPVRQLKHWLDPDNTGQETLQGSYDEIQVIAGFQADTTVIQTGALIGFSNLSQGDPTQFHWIFSGGEPSEAFTENPGKITYKRYGEFDVTLIVSNEISSDTLIREKYVKTIPGIYPNPANEQVTILLGSHEYDDIRVEIFDMHGIRFYSNDFNISGLYSLRINTAFLKQAVYVIDLSVNGVKITRQKLVIARY